MKKSGLQKGGQGISIASGTEDSECLKCKTEQSFSSFLCLQSSWFGVPNLDIDFLLVITRHIFHASCRKLVVHQDSTIFSLFLLPVSMTMLHYFGKTFNVNDSWSWNPFYEVNYALLFCHDYLQTLSFIIFLFTEFPFQVHRCCPEQNIEQRLCSHPS